MRRLIRLLCAALLLPALGCGPPAVEAPAGGSTAADETTAGPAVSVSATSTTPPGTSTSTSTSSGLDNTSSPPNDFIEQPDGGVCGVAPDGASFHCSACSVELQDCPAGEKCMPWANDGGDAWNATRCSPIADDPAAVGDPCTVEDGPTSGFDDCDGSSMCWDVDPDTLEGTCVAFCDSNAQPSECGPDETCIVANEGVISICLPTCDPTDAESCPARQLCTPIDDVFVCTPSAGGEGLACDGGLCSPDQTCVGAELLEACPGTACCTPWCDLDAVDPDLPCAAMPGHACQPYYPPGEAPPGYAHVGYCGLP